MEGLTKETIASKASNEQVDKQWNERLKEGWWKNAKITIIGETPKENHRRAAAQEHQERHSRKEIDWNDAHHSQLTWQLAALRTNVQTLPTIIIIKDPARGHNSVAMDCDHVKAIVLLPYEAIIKAVEIAALMEGQTLSLSNDSGKASTDKDARFTLSPHKGPCKRPIKGQAVPFKDQWANGWFRNSNRLMELMFAALADPRDNKGINWLLLIWRRIDKTPFMVLGKTPCELQEGGAWYTHQMTEKNLLPEMRG